MQDKISYNDLQMILALVRGRTLAGAARHLVLDPSTVFRNLQRLERQLEERLFERSRQGYEPSALAQELARRGERIEAELADLSEFTSQDPGGARGILRISTTDGILQGLLAPILAEFSQQHPLLELEITVANEFANLGRREADVALRATQRPPEHLIGRNLGVLQAAVYAAPGYLQRHPEARQLDQADWIGVDHALPEHASVQWRRQQLPGKIPRYRCNSVIAVADAIRFGIGVGVLPAFLARPAADFVALSEPLPLAETHLWLLTNPEMITVRRVALFADFLKNELHW